MYDGCLKHGALTTQIMHHPLLKRILPILLATAASVCAVETQYITPNRLTVANGGFYAQDDAVSGALPIGFTFRYGGVDYTEVTMSTNGVLFFTGATSQYTNSSLTNMINSQGVYALWDDLYLGTAAVYDNEGEVELEPANEFLSRSLYYTAGEPGSRVFIMQWTTHYSFAEPLEVGTFNIVLYEGSNKIDIYYRNMLGASAQRGYGASATIGIVANNGYSSEYSQNTPVATEGKLLTYTPEAGGTSPYTLTERLVTPATTAAIQTYFLTAGDAPQVPSNLSASPSSPTVTSASLSWDLSTLGQTPATYTIRLADNAELQGVTQFGPFTSENRTYVLENLTAGATYYWQVVSSLNGQASTSTISSFTQQANNAPVATGTSFETGFETLYSGTLSATDADNTPTTAGLIYSIVTSPTGGVAVITDSATGAFTYTPSVGFSGADSFTFKAFDGTAYSNEATVNVTVGAGGPVAPKITTLMTKGEDVAGAGVEGSGIPEGAKWRAFSLPSINDEGDIALSGTIAGPKASIIGVFAGTTQGMKVLAKRGDAVPGVDGAIYATFKTPLLAADGAVAWMARMSNARGSSGITRENNLAIFLDEDGAGPLQAVVVARSGQSTVGVEGATNKSFHSLVLNDTTVAYLGTMTPGLGEVTEANDLGLWVWDRTTRESNLGVREGDAIEGANGATVKIIGALGTRAGSAGQGRGVVGDSEAVAVAARLTASDRSHRIATVNGAGELTIVEQAGAPAPAFNPESTNHAAWLTFGLPTQNSAGELAFAATVRAGTGMAKSTNNLGLYQEMNGELSLIVRKGDAGAEVPGSTFVGFKDPVNGAGGTMAFVGTLKPDPANGVLGSNNLGVWWRDTEGDLQLVARKGFEPVGIPGATWANFTSLALPDTDMGPIFLATLTRGAGGVTTANDVGLWAVDAAGDLHLLLREGAQLGDKTVKTFSLLSYESGSPAQTRSFNNVGGIICRAHFTDGTISIVKVQMALPQVQLPPVLQ